MEFYAVRYTFSALQTLPPPRTPSTHVVVDMTTSKSWMKSLCCRGDARSYFGNVYNNNSDASVRHCVRLVLYESGSCAARGNRRAR